MQSLHVLSMLCPCPVNVLSRLCPCRVHIVSMICPCCRAHRRHWSFGHVLIQVMLLPLCRCSQGFLQWLTGLQDWWQSRGTINTSQTVLPWLKPSQHPHLNHRSLWNTPRPSQPQPEEWFTMATGGWCNFRGIWTVAPLASKHLQLWLFFEFFSPIFVQLGATLTSPFCLCVGKRTNVATVCVCTWYTQNHNSYMIHIRSCN